LLYKVSNYLLPLMAACGAISKRGKMLPYVILKAYTSK